MLETNPQSCEVKVEGAWQRISVGEAFAHYRMALKRCPSCHGAVITRSSYIHPITIGLNHRKVHDGCPLLPARFNGTPALHPQALA